MLPAWQVGCRGLNERSCVPLALHSSNIVLPRASLFGWQRRIIFLWGTVSIGLRTTTVRPNVLWLRQFNQTTGSSSWCHGGQILGPGN